MNLVLTIATGLVLARWLVELRLGILNSRHVVANSDRVPDAFIGVIDEPTYKKSIEYTLAKGRFTRLSDAWSTTILLLALLGGVLPWAYARFIQAFPDSVWATAACLFGIFTVIGFTSLPLDWYEQFRLEDRFGFNTTTQTTWWLDRLKGLLLGAIIGCPLLALILKPAG